MDLDDKITAILNSPMGKAHYRQRARPLNDRLPKKKAATKPKRGSWKDALRLHTRLIFRLRKYGESKQDKALLKIISGCKKSQRCADAAWVPSRLWWGIDSGVISG